MTRQRFTTTLALAFCVAGPVAGQTTLETVLARGELICGTHEHQPGFAVEDGNGNWHGFDVGLCRALAAAVLGDRNAVSFVKLSAETCMDALAEGEIDLLARGKTWTFRRVVGAAVSFVEPAYYGEQRIMVARAQGATSVRELDGARICAERGTMAAQGLSDYAQVNGLSFEFVPVANSDHGKATYLEKGCDAYTADISMLSALKASLAEPGEHVILPEATTKQPMGPLVRAGDDHWADIVRWTLFALIAAEELGITSLNLEELKTNSPHPEIRRLLGSEGGFGAMLGIRDDWAARAIGSVGNYGELFASTIGEQTPIGISRGLNVPWTQGGLLYAPPFR
ncbi:MAG: amino acid ABC transporter substrate-binding protein [Natronohydrobacter sp.]|nr:amino acid ABC transporter substrate-binding protein [Natronohydrobacter sp.]